VVDLAVVGALLNGEIEIEDKASWNVLRRPATEEWQQDATMEDLAQQYRCMVSFYQAPHNSAVFPESRVHFEMMDMTPEYLAQYLDLEWRAAQPRSRHGDDDDEGGDGKDEKNERGKDEDEDIDLVASFGDKNLAAFYTGLRQAVNKLDQKSNKGSPKVPWVMAKIVENRLQTVVFSSFLDSGINQVAKLLTKAKIPFGVVSGKVPAKERSETVKRYNAGELMVLLISKAGGEGLDLKNTRQVILLEPTWNKATMQQVIGRAVRYMSHASLPADQRVVDVWVLVLRKPRSWYEQMDSERKQFVELVAQDQIATLKEQIFEFAERRRAAGRRDTLSRETWDSLPEAEKERLLESQRFHNKLRADDELERNKKRKRRPSRRAGGTKRRKSKREDDDDDDDYDPDDVDHQPKLIIRDSVDDVLLKLSRDKEAPMETFLTMLKAGSIELQQC
jgi:superfamily II DNA/RNA helicase